MTTITVFAVLLASSLGAQGHPLTHAFPTFVVQQPLSLPSNFYQPLRPIPSSYDLSFESPFYQPQLPPFFNELKPSNETTVKPSTESTTSSEVATESTTPKVDVNETALTWDEVFKNTVISPSFGFPREPVVIPDAPFFPQAQPEFVVPQTPTYDLIVEPWYSLNKAYGLPGFRPFYYEQYLRQLNASCADPSRHNNSPSDRDKKNPLNKFETDVKDILTRYDPGTIVFDNPDSPSFKKADVKTDDDLDVRHGKQENDSNNDAFSKVYKDIMFLNKSYLSTVAPYLHK